MNSTKTCNICKFLYTFTTIRFTLCKKERIFGFFRALHEKKRPSVAICQAYFVLRQAHPVVDGSAKETKKNFQRKTQGIFGKRHKTLERKRQRGQRILLSKQRRIYTNNKQKNIPLSPQKNSNQRILKFQVLQRSKMILLTVILQKIVRQVGQKHIRVFPFSICTLVL